MTTEPGTAMTAAPSGSYRSAAPQQVVVGPGTLARLPELLAERGRQRLFIVTSPSLARRGPLLDAVRGLLGGACVGAFEDVVAHVPVATVRAAAEQARRAGADALLSLGGGSAVDTAKAVALLLALPPAAADRLLADPGAGLAEPPADLPAHIAVPTTASAAEFTGVVGITDPAAGRKHVLLEPRLTPGAVILDPTATLPTPPTLWLSTAIRALDHAVEALYGRGANPFTDGLALEAVRRLFTYLPRCVAVPQDLGARGEIQVAAWFSGWAAVGAGTGLSHGIGYVLGGRFGVPHGICSCLTLPAVMRWSLPASAAAQARVARAAGAVAADTPDAAAAARAADAVGELIGTLGLPRRLRDVGQLGEGDLAAVAELAMVLPHARSHPRRPADAAELLTMLRAAW